MEQKTVFYFPQEGERNFHLLGEGIEEMFRVDFAKQEDWPMLDAWIEAKKEWIFCWICYDAKNAIEHISSSRPDSLGFPQLFFVVPQNVVRWNDDGREILKGTWSDSYMDFSLPFSEEKSVAIAMKARVSKQAYLDSIHQLMRHVQLGNIYEVNFCQEFFAEVKLTSPLTAWKKLRSMTRAPFSAFVRHDELFALCASPERFLQKKKSKLISQPIKGTIRRGRDSAEDEVLKKNLVENPKERSENVMIVDLVRNDLSKSAMRGSVKVDELIGVHTFPTVHHLISTISCKVQDGVSFSQLMRDTFPMGSMTGAPKIRAMQLIEQHEYSTRGLYSGTIGYITPDGDFDLNVVIRSVLYNDQIPYVSFHVGGAITAACKAEDEYDECLLKAEALIKALS